MASFCLEAAGTSIVRSADRVCSYLDEGIVTLNCHLPFHEALLGRTAPNARYVAILAGLTTRKGDCAVAGENRKMASVKVSKTGGSFGLLSLPALLPDPLSQQHKDVKDQQ